MRRIATFIQLLALLCNTNIISAQDVQSSRRMSQKVETTRTIGNTDIKIVYHSPLAKGRKIFGGIVPYNFVVDGKEYAWRAGSNERTTIELEHDVRVNGHALKAGKYGLVILVAEKEWTFVFTNDFSWGAFQYQPSQDVLRVHVPVKKTSYQEWLSYHFVNPAPESVDILLHWTDNGAILNIQTDVGRNIIEDLNKKEQKVIQDYIQLAEEYRNTKKSDSSWLSLSKAATLINGNQVKQHQKFAFNIIKAELLIDQGKHDEGRALLNKTIAASQGFNMYYYGLNMLLVKKNKKRAYDLLSQNAQNNPSQWQGHLALGEYYLHDGNQKEAVKSFKHAYKHAPDNWKNYARYLYLQNKLVLERNSTN